VISGDDILLVVLDDLRLITGRSKDCPQKDCPQAFQLRRDVNALFAKLDLLVGRKEQTPGHPNRREGDSCDACPNGCSEGEDAGLEK
jgi:hypothetical protein